MIINKILSEVYYLKFKKKTLLSKERMLSNWKHLKYIKKNGVDGAIVECGVWKGGSAMMMIQALIDSKDTERAIYLYDTYAGMSEPTLNDKKNNSSVLAFDKWNQMQKGEYNDWCYASLNEVKTNIKTLGYPTQNIHFVVGKVEETIPNTIPDKIAVLRLDTDWYESTKHELKYLYPRLEKGGVLILDDYGSWAGARKAVDEYFEEIGLNPNLITIDGTGRYHIKS